MSEKFLGTLMAEGVHHLGPSSLSAGRRCRTGQTFVFSAAEVEHVERDPHHQFDFEPYSGPREVGYLFANGEPHHLPEEPSAEAQAEPTPEATDTSAPA